VRNRRAIIAFDAVRPFPRFLISIALISPLCSGYSVLTHEAVVDAAWKQSIRPLLLQKYPATTPDQLLEAHAYAYGGCILQDMGYYPFGSKLFSDLVHYVRTADFVTNLLKEEQNVDEYAFALGALAHYTSDNSGHPIGVNRAEPIEYPKLRAKFGDRITYEQDPPDHLKTEFGFDVVQVAQGHYAPQAYHDLIGFQVAKPVLERAFLDTYSVPFSAVVSREDLAFGTFRFTVSHLLPEASKAAWAAKKNEIVAAQPGITKSRFIYQLRRSSYEKNWGRDYQRPGWFARFLAFLFHLVPKIGPFRTLAFHPPSPEAEKLMMASFNTTLDRYRRHCTEIAEGTLTLTNTNLDTGAPDVPGKYRLALQAWSHLLEKLAEKNVAPSPELRQEILDYFTANVTPESDKARQELATLSRQ